MATEWNGKGTPPVGTECEATWGGKAMWRRCYMLPEAYVAVRLTAGWDVFDMNNYARNQSFEFRPLQSKEQKQVAEIDAIIANYSSASGLELAQEIYNAGFRKVVE